MRTLLGPIAAMLVLVGLAGCLDSEPAEIAGETSNATALTFKEPVDLICPDYPTYRGNCGGFGEPTLEVAGDGTIWYSAVCCVGQSPPIWLSHDGGLTFEALPFADGTGVTRDAAGVEGDFAIDDAGNVYFFDITAATSYFTKYSPDGTHQHTKPDVFTPLVDRPWVRAGVENEVWIFYNTATSTILHHSTDGGLTWDFPGGTTFPCALMAMGQGPARDDLILAGCSSDPSAWISADGGATFTQRIHLPLPAGESGTEQYLQSSMDAAGNTYVPVTHTHHPDGEGGPVHEVISVYRISPDLEVSGPMTVTPMDGLVDKPWSIAGKDGVYAMAYYHADNVNRTGEAEEAVWHLKISYTLNGDEADPTWHTVIADADPVLEGNFGRSLGDFLQLRQAENGDLVVAYAENHGELVNKFVRSEGIDFGPEVFRNGPQP